MKEIVYRRYKRLTDEKEPLPQLVIIDGGKGQLSSAMESIRELKLEKQMTVVGLAKNVEELFFTDDQQSLKLSYNSESLNLIRTIRDEVHRFGISFHRQKRSKGAFTTQLNGIEGIGEATIELLLKEFKSLANIRAASEQEITTLIGAKKAQLLRAVLDKEK